MINIKKHFFIIKLFLTLKINVFLLILIILLFISPIYIKTLTIANVITPIVGITLFLLGKFIYDEEKFYKKSLYKYLILLSGCYHSVMFPKDENSLIHSLSFYKQKLKQSIDDIREKHLEYCSFNNIKTPYQHYLSPIECISIGDSILKKLDNLSNNCNDNKTRDELEKNIDYHGEKTKKLLNEI